MLALKARYEDGLNRSLRRAMQEHLGRRQACYGVDDWIPKCHFALHLPDMFARWGIVLDTFVTERSHLLPKRAAEHMLFTQTFERSVIARAVAHRLHNLQAFRNGRFFTTPVAYVPELAPALSSRVVAARSAHLDGLDVHQGDVVVFTDVVLEVIAVACDGERFYIVGHQYHVLEQHSRSWTTCRRLRSVGRLAIKSQGALFPFPYPSHAHPER